MLSKFVIASRCSRLVVIVMCLVSANFQQVMSLVQRDCILMLHLCDLEAPIGRAFPSAWGAFKVECSRSNFLQREYWMQTSPLRNSCSGAQVESNWSERRSLQSRGNRKAHKTYDGIWPSSQTDEPTTDLKLAKWINECIAAIGREETARLEHDTGFWGKAAQETVPEHALAGAYLVRKFKNIKIN
jgi:hypothetical protein